MKGLDETYFKMFMWYFDINIESLAQFRITQQMFILYIFKGIFDSQLKWKLSMEIVLLWPKHPTVHFE